ncbi:sensor histidine kinase [Rothia sp. 88186D007BW]
MTNPLRKLHPKHRRAHPSGTQGQRTGSVRLRIVAWMVLVTAFIITGLIFTVREILISEVGSNAAASAESEISEFRNFAEIGVDPTTAAPFEDLNQLLTAFVSRQYTGHSEQLIGITPQQVIFIDEQEQFSDNSGYRLHHDRDLLTTITSNNRTSGIAQTPAGPVHWGTVEINLNTDTGAHTGHLIVVEYIQPELDEVQHTIITMIWVGLGGLAATILIAWLVAGRITKPIRSLRTVAQEINDKNFSGRVAVKGDDDVAAMGHTFNQMLDRLEESAMIERQFMDDVSHELRTPITIVRGHLELMDRTEEQDQTLQLVDDELERMGRIVADLLTLAKSERPNFVSPHPVDVADLMITLDSKVQAFTDHRWMISDIAEGEVNLDEQRITQALVQLCANAAQYSPEGTTISIGSAFEDTGKKRELKLWVRDQGPGVSEEDAATLFERFKRNNAKNPATAKKHSVGAGLGLAIVRSIAEAHGGSVWIAQPDNKIGAIFGISLPAEPATESGKDDTDPLAENISSVRYPSWTK